MPDRLVVVFDTNVLIPLILPASRSTRLANRLLGDGHQVVVSPAILAEVQEKMLTKSTLREWLGVSDDQIHRFVNDLAALCVVVITPANVPRYVEDDPDDDSIIAAALQCGAGYVISEDRHLLRLDGFQGLHIMTRDDFLRELDRLGVP